MSTKSEIAALRARGLSVSEAAAKLALTPSYVTQLEQDSEYQAIYSDLVTKQRIVNHSTVTKIDGHYDSLELKLAHLMDSQSDVVLAALVQDPRLMLSAAKTFNSLKRRSVGENLGEATTSEYIPLTLPAYLVEAQMPVVRHNAQNEVIEVDGRILVSATDTALKSQLAQLSKAQLPAIEHQPSTVKIPNLSSTIDPTLLMP